MIKRFILTLNMLVLGAMLLLPSQVFAAANSSCDKTFLGIKPWHAYLDKTTENGSCEIDYHEDNKGNVDIAYVVIRVGLAVVDILLGFAGIAAFVFIVLSGFKFVFSQGDPGKEKAAREALVNSVIGLVIALISIGVVSFIGNALRK